MDGPNEYSYVRQNPWSAFDPTGLGTVRIADKLKKVGGKLLSQADILLRSERKVINGRRVRLPRGHVPGKVFNPAGDLGKAYPKGVKFSKDGYPDFGPYAKRSNVNIGKVTGTSSDFTAANKKMKFDKTPDGMTWHHHENGTMQLVPTDIHKGVPHTGGAAIASASAKDIAVSGAAMFFPETVDAIGNGGSVVPAIVEDAVMTFTPVGDAVMINDMITPEKKKPEVQQVEINTGSMTLMRPLKNLNRDVDFKPLNTSDE